jgi:hypothetical protein
MQLSNFSQRQVSWPYFLRESIRLGQVPVHDVIHVDGVRLCLRTAATSRPIFHPPDDM